MYWILQVYEHKTHHTSTILITEADPELQFSLPRWLHREEEGAVYKMKVLLCLYCWFQSVFKESIFSFLVAYFRYIAWMAK